MRASGRRSRERSSSGFRPLFYPTTEGTKTISDEDDGATHPEHLLIYETSLSANAARKLLSRGAGT
jgi:hypothetical protein